MSHGLHETEGVRQDFDAPEELKPGEYGHDAAGQWFAVPPVAGVADPIFLGNHNRIEHEDGTISIDQRVELPGPEGTFAWTIDRGVWKVAL